MTTVEATKQRVTILATSVTSATQKRLLAIPFKQISTTVAKSVVGFTKKYWIFGSIAIAVSVPQLLLSWQSIVGVYADFAALAVLLSIGLYNERSRKLAISAAILPLASIITMCVPNSSAFTDTTVYYGAILLFALVYRYMFTLDEPTAEQTALGKKYLFLIFPMIVVGEALGGIGYLMLYHNYNYTSASLVTVTLAAVVFAVAEVMLFQGLIQQQAGKFMDPILAAGLAAVAYTFASIGHATLLTVVSGAIAGVALAATYYFKPNLILGMTINTLMKLSYIALVATFVLR